MERNENHNGLFILGLIFGILISSAILLTSAEDKQKIIKKIKNKFNDLFKDKIEPEIKREKKKIKKVNKIIVKKIVEPIKKISVDIPKGIETLNLTPVKIVKSKKVFKKSK